ncbi:DUF3617 domain-containing protein [Sulfuricurvum sp.]|uniref:DUF3617 domain-containing protein n=1 Tax=Sulfuricurvum sp. TaxID=2025608 RepID=UPI002621E663|nr:DUF3617 domain-containing protein [Sulfuricurvum sp.]MDD2266979.1 DUF3617 domain-containing protein [Sulfuricurvum sp.]MDD2784078.1 DUF3617 domain-containing protein [Sulfuricurvum sp.]
MNSKIISGLFLTTLLGLQSLHAETTIRPGVWEYTSTIKSQSGEIEKSMAQMNRQMASLPPEQRKMMEKMMASQGVTQNAKGTTVRVCVTKENTKEGLIPPSDGQCQQKVLRRSGNTVWFKFTCKGNPPSTGEGEFTFVGDNAYKGKTTIRTTSEGKTEVIQMDQTGKWISNDCKKVSSIPTKN